jgi:hypothetical protein
MARKAYVQYTPIAPLGLLGYIEAVVTADSPPARANQLEQNEGIEVLGLFVVNIALGTLQPI